jgi:hypothetical protein
MTAQIGDGFKYRGESWSQCGLKGSGLFEPSQHGIQVGPLSSACWRGFHCEYEVAEGQLLLTQVTVGLREDDYARAELGNGPLVFGKPLSIRTKVIPAKRRRKKGKSWVVPAQVEVVSPPMVEGLRERVPFTGRILLGKGFVPGLYVHMGLHQARRFRRVFELTFEAGRLVEECDRSAQMAEMRASPFAVFRWILRSFSQKYPDIDP